jgi:hypothetical protein
MDWRGWVPFWLILSVALCISIYSARSDGASENDGLWVAIIIFGSASVVLAAALVSTWKKQDREKPDRDSYNYQKHPEARLLPGFFHSLLKESRTHREQREDEHHKKQIIEWITLFAVLVTAGFVIGQWREMVKVYKPIGEQAEAITEQIKILKIQLKPHLSPRIESLGVVSNGQIALWILTPVWKNVGGTEAVKAFGWDSARFFEKADEADKYDFLSRHGSPDEMISKTVAQTEEFIQVSKPFTPEMATKISGLNGPVYVIWGHIEYGDPLFPHITHHGHFCDRAIPANVGGVISFPLFKAECNFSD